MPLRRAKLQPTLEALTRFVALALVEGCWAPSDNDFRLIGAERAKSFPAEDEPP
jgi:hypothetical protein